jgi:hypothetical protein
MTEINQKYVPMEFGRLKCIRTLVFALLAAVMMFGAVTGKAIAADKTFMFNIRAARDLETFRTYAELASRMKKYGTVQIAISGLADKAWFQIPEGGSPWHEYCCYMNSPWMYYPHPLIEPHIPADWVAANVKLLQAKRKIINEYGLEAIFAGKNSEMLPESFFEANPRLRGPRVDHPRRSSREEFSWCVDLEETREIIKWTMAELLRNAPEIKVFSSGTNDAGSGLCWAAGQYPGPNGPRHCMHRGVGQRTHDLVEAVQEGARMGGGEIIFQWDNVNFWRNEDQIVLAHLPENAILSRSDRTRMGVGTQINEAWPFLGLIDPLGIIQSMERYRSPRIKTVSVSTSAMYDRHEDNPETVGKVLDLVEECIAEPTDGMMEQLEKLRKISALWGGEQNTEQVFSALYDIHQALQLKRLLSARYSNFYCGVSMRHLTRPLVIKPDLLTPEEEAYFLPYVFNPNQNEGRMDYIDLHGGRMTGTNSWNDRHVGRIISMANSAGRRLNDVKGAPEHDFLHKLSLSIRMWASELRSIHNFYHAQLIRDENAAILAGEPRVMEKVGNWDGEPGNLAWNEIMRDEFDNTHELIALLEDGGSELVAAAKTPEYEDTFIMGPDLVRQLQKKVKIMREHWLDVQSYIASPHK